MCGFVIYANNELLLTDETEREAYTHPESKVPDPARWTAIKRREKDNEAGANRWRVGRI